MAKYRDVKLNEAVETSIAIDDTTESASTVYSSEKINDSFLALTGGTLTGGLTITAGTDAVNSSKITDKDGNVIFSADTVNNRISVGYGNTVSTPLKQFNVSGDINITKVAKPTAAQLTAMTLTEQANASYNLQAGKKYCYGVAFVTATGDTPARGDSNDNKNITIGATNARVLIENIPISPDPKVIGRKIYRTTGDGNVYLAQRLTIINDNTTTSYTDNIADASLVSTDTYYRKDNLTVKGIYVDDVIYALFGLWNISIGQTALQNLTTATENVAIGMNGALSSITTGGVNIGIGSAAGGSLTTGSNNVAIGYATLNGINMGGENVGIGSNAIRLTGSNGSSNYNVGIGSSALHNIVAGNHANTGIGWRAGQGFQGSYNIFIGNEAGQITAATIGNYNIFIGSDIGDNVTTGADGNILIGKQLDLPVANGDNQLSIGNLIFGTGLDGTGLTISTGKIGIGTTTPDKRVEINSVDGNCLRLTYNDANGSATYYADFNVSSAGVLTINASGGIIKTANDVEITDSSKGIILTSPDNSRWRVTVDNSGNLITTSI